MSKGLWIILPEHSEGQIRGVWGVVAYGITEPLSGPEAS